MVNPRHRRVRLTATATAAAVLATLVCTTAASAADTLPWEGERAAGPNQPYQHGYNPDQLLRWDPATDPYADMLRSRVPLQERAEPNADTQRDPALPAETQMLALAGDYGNAFFESHAYTNAFAQHLFGFWQYTDYYASWHGMAALGTPPELYDPSLEWTQRWFEFGMLNLPNPAYTDAAHRNGVRSLGGVFFSDNDRGSQTYSELLVRDEHGTFPAVTKLAEIADYYGFDGYFMNQEQVSVVMDDAEMATYREFLQAMRDAGLYVTWYDSVTDDGEIDYQNEFNELNSPWVVDPDLGRVSDSIFLNYWWDHEMLTASAEHAESVGLDPLRDVFVGLEAGMYQFDQPYDLRDNLGDDGAPMNAIATLGSDFVHSDYEHKTDNAMQWEAFDRERQWWTGTPTGTGAPAEDAWQGISTFIAERTAITGTTFATSFNTGHGLGYWRDGELVSTQEWGNIGVQDLPVTWQWWLEGEGAEGLQVDYDYGPDYVAAERFDHEQLGAYEGGSSLALSGTLAGDAVLRLYQTDLAVTAGTSVELAYAQPAGDDVELSLALVLESAPDDVVEVPVGTSTTDGWVTAEVDLSEYAGETISTLGVTLGTADGASDVQVNLGRLAVLDGTDHTPAQPTGLTVDQALRSTDELYLSWDLADFDDVRRYDAYVDGRWLGGVYGDVLYVKDLPVTSGTLELVAVGPDGSESESATVALDLDSGPGDVTAEATAEGTVTVSWAEPVPTGTQVTVTAQYADAFTAEVTTAEDGATTATVSGAPVDGARFVATVDDGAATPVSVTGTFADTELEPYPASAATIDGDSLVLTRPTPDDWSTLTVLEDGEPLLFDTTYSQGERPEMVRGRTTRPSLVQTLSRTDSEVVAVLTDYAGNEATTVLREGAGEATPPPAGETPGEPGEEVPSEEAPTAGEDVPPADEDAVDDDAAAGGSLPSTGASVGVAALLALALLGTGAAVVLRRRSLATA